MNIIIQSDGRRRLRAELLKHRARYDLTDAIYVQDVLKISVNTYKKCVAHNESLPLTLSRQTFRNLVRNAGLTPDGIGVEVPAAGSNPALGTYASDDYTFMCKRYVLYRRSFLHARNLNRSTLDIWVDEARGCLCFCETEDYVSDLGLPHEQKHTGDVHVDPDRSLLSLLGNHSGRVRLMLLVIPQRVIGREGLRMRGALLTHGRPRGYWQPTVASLYVEEAPDPQLLESQIRGTMRPDWAEYQRISDEIGGVEDYITIDTALLKRLDKPA